MVVENVVFFEYGKTILDYVRLLEGTLVLTDGGLGCLETSSKMSRKILANKMEMSIIQ